MTNPTNEKTGGSFSNFKRVVFWVASFASIAILLLHLSGRLSMHQGAMFLFAPACLAMVVVWVLARKQDDRLLLQQLRVGLIGGLWGTLGYDLFRVPFHLLGLNPFAPIYAYGMWFCGEPNSSVFTDSVGYVYHLSNGITFGWIYSLLMYKRNWAWAVGWALLLETLAIVTVFGVVFSLRSYSGVVILAYVAHLFYGVPLGVACQYPDQADAFHFKAIHMPTWLKPTSWCLLALLVGMGIWFTNATLPIIDRASHSADGIRFTERQLVPGWSNLEVDSVMTIRNDAANAQTVLIRPPGIVDNAEITKMKIEPSTQMTYSFQETGIYQIGIENSPIRSVFVAAQKDQRYKPKSK